MKTLTKNDDDIKVAVERTLWVQFQAIAALQDTFSRELLARIIRKEIAAWESKRNMKIATLISTR